MGAVRPARIWTSMEGRACLRERRPKCVSNIFRGRARPDPEDAVNERGGVHIAARLDHPVAHRDRRMRATSARNQKCCAEQEAKRDGASCTTSRGHLVEWRRTAAAWTEPLGHRLRVRAFLAWMSLGVRPARAQPHRAVTAWAFLRFGFDLGFRLFGHAAQSRRATRTGRAAAA